MDAKGKITWEWTCSEHFDELGFSEKAKNTLSRNPGIMLNGSAGDWTHINSMSTLDPNRWYNSGDERFHPDNIIWDLMRIVCGPGFSRCFSAPFFNI